MPLHCESSDHGCGICRAHALVRKIVSRLSSVALDTGDADEFTFSGTGGFACFRGLSPYEQATVAVAS
ncbi:hypothetical protein [Mesorhizobium loti]|uniref:hypothetical protein n=1 Tax=Rhizobium loti TaxID=381 RepID=UPI0003F63C51|nr:hypothetical protein [Mesorhizobium loti]